MFFFPTKVSEADSSISRNDISWKACPHHTNVTMCFHQKTSVDCGTQGHPMLDAPCCMHIFSDSRYNCHCAHEQEKGVGSDYPYLKSKSHVLSLLETEVNARVPSGWSSLFFSTDLYCHGGQSATNSIHPRDTAKATGPNSILPGVLKIKMLPLAARSAKVLKYNRDIDTCQKLPGCALHIMRKAKLVVSFKQKTDWAR